MSTLTRGVGHPAGMQRFFNLSEIQAIKLKIAKNRKIPALIIKEKTMQDLILKHIRESKEFWNEAPYSFSWKDCFINIIIMAMYTAGVACVAVAVFGR